MRRAADGSENRKRSSSRNAARSGNNHHRYGRPDIVRDDESQNRRPQGKIDKVSRQAIRSLLDGSPRLFGAFDGFNDSSERRVTTEFPSADFQSARLIHGAGVDRISLGFLDRHGLAGDRRLFHERAATKDNSIHRYVPARLYDDRFVNLNLIGRYFNHLTVAADCNGSGEKIEKTLNGPPASANCETLQNLSGQDEASDNQSGEELSNRQSREESDGHREFHRHLSLNDILESLFENRISADQRCRDADDADVRKRLPEPKPDRSGSHGHKSNAGEFSPFHSVIVLFMLSARVRFVQFRGIPNLAEMWRGGRTFSDNGRRTHRQIPSAAR